MPFWSWLPGPLGPHDLITYWLPSLSYMKSLPQASFGTRPSLMNGSGPQFLHSRPTGGLTMRPSLARS